ncbi:MAG: twin-arginine translocase TatA/TatE family subunit [Flavobacteriales bacterium]|nr:twin-arginine translocase TatA/TatE family subunit [Flavobacteriales bacterium]MCX7768781.1 twin-arginine translocase TatA/TatE family subunit [Flavobacteriales bacterium]MDW8409425.1 twin-arginine translocase TatA/TatE family subunit [Flavobacteriales bacterium]
MSKTSFLYFIYGSIGWPQIVLIIVVALLLFGGRKIPELMRGLGQGIREFKKGMSEDKSRNEEENTTPMKKDS